MSTYKLIVMTAIAFVVTSCSDQQQRNNSDIVYVPELKYLKTAEVAAAMDAADNCICHIPPGNPNAAHTICIGAPAVSHHIKHHNDYVGACGNPIEEIPPVVENPPNEPPTEEPPVEEPAPSPTPEEPPVVYY